MHRRINELATAWRQLWAPETLPPASSGPTGVEPAPRARSLLRSLLAREELPTPLPRPAAGPPPFFSSLCAREQLPAPGAADTRQPQAPRE